MKNKSYRFEAKEKAKTRSPDSNPCSTSPEASTVPDDPFYFVVVLRRLRETDVHKSMTTDSSSSSGGGST